MYEVDLAEATGGVGNFCPDIQPDDKKTFRGNVTGGNRDGIPPNFRAAESQNHKL